MTEIMVIPWGDEYCNNILDSATLNDLDIQKIGFDNPGVCFIERDAAETNKDIKQLIPYCVVRFEDQVLSYSRGPTLGEERLHGKFSIGFGGHVDKTDIDEHNGIIDVFSNNKSEAIERTFYLALERELEEELGLTGDYYYIERQILIDNQTDVGKVHLGVWYDVYVSDVNDVSPKESGIQNFEWKSIQDLKENVDNYENWSRFCISGL